ncbi:MAG: hypothetical protein Q9N32_03075 [Gammaproteobacteria bacterium]|nr:hypothetical protein [Gammaproteobacteria bacterium]
MNTNNYQTMIARQAIFNSDLSVYAYELLYRGELRVNNPSLAGASGDYTTSQVIPTQNIKTTISRTLFIFVKPLHSKRYLKNTLTVHVHRFFIV